jgi:DNA-binding NtrC family response regulator
MIVMSGYHNAETVKEAARRAAAGFLAKPFTPDEFIEAVRQMLGTEEIHGEDESPGD